MSHAQQIMLNAGADPAQMFNDGIDVVHETGINQAP